MIYILYTVAPVETAGSVTKMAAAAVTVTNKPMDVHRSSPVLLVVGSIYVDTLISM